MQYIVPLTARPELPALERELQSVDPAALLDLDADGGLRISTWMTRGELGDALARAGLRFAEHALVQLPSECCGGCGG